MKTNKDLIIEPNAQLLREESTAKKSHGPASTVTGGEAKRKAVA